MLADLLKTYLASTFAYYLKAHYFHWNVEGPNFGELHEFFSNIYEDAYGAVDIIAEYIRTTEEYAPGSFERFQELTQIQGQTKVPRARLMLEELLADTQTMKDMSKQLFDVATADGREDVANFAAERQSAHGKYMWQIKSYLKDARAWTVAQDHNDIYTIVERLRILEEGLDKNQRSVNQLGPTFKPKTVAVLTAKKDPKNPMAGKLVGGDESIEHEAAVLEADMAEDVLNKVQKSFQDFIKQAEEQIKDTDIKEKKQEDTDLKSRDKKDRGLKAKGQPASTDPDDDEQQDLPSDLAYQRGESPYDAPEPQTESAAVKTVMNEYGVYEMHGNERDGFEIRSGGRSLPSRFQNLDQAEMAIEMFVARKKKQDESQDYLEEE